MAKILVTGATGNTCSILIPALLSDGQEVRAFVRNEEKAQSLKDAGAEIYVGDLDQGGTIDSALQGIDKVYMCTWNGPTASAQGKNIVEAIKRAGTKPFVVRHSAFGVDGSRLIQQINEVDSTLKGSGIPWTMLKPTFFMQNLMMASQSIQDNNNIYWDWADGMVGMIDIRDVADSAFGALTGKAKQGQEYILTGPESISMHDVATSFTKVLGKEINYVAVPHEASKEAMIGMGFPEFIVDGFIELNHGFTKGFADTTNSNVEALSGHSPRSIDDFTNDFKSYFGG
ncbi:MAG: SDR family oxidoreductase [Candidatus Neomarinimicrobiota bacterium]